VSRTRRSPARPPHGSSGSSSCMNISSSISSGRNIRISDISSDSGSSSGSDSDKMNYKLY
jgi:hypothetical protein